MRLTPVVILLVASLAASGCLDTGPVTDGGGRGDDGRDSGGGPVFHAPWWGEGEWWQMTLHQEGKASSFKLVHFWNDTRTGHFWLGLADRAAVVDHALHDTNPILGRIHWGILTPHESGIHAEGMYSFDREAGLSPGDRWDGTLWGREWQLLASDGDRPGTIKIEGRAVDGARLTYDYDPSVKWFTELTVKDGDGNEEIRATITDHGTGATGTYHFIRGRDYYEGPEGGTEDTFQVCQAARQGKTPCANGEADPITSLAIEIDATFSSPGRLEFVDPDGGTAYETTMFSGEVETTFEIPDPKPGTWTVRYLGSVPQGIVHGTGFIEYKATL